MTSVGDGGNGGGGSRPLEINRRELLVGLGALVALGAVSGCGSSSGSSGGDAGERRLGPTSTSRPPALAGDPFGLGVASGDPEAASVILWARLAPDPLAADGRGGMPDTPVDVVWEVAADERFTKVAARGVATAAPDEGHSLHVDADGLEPATDYHYRFTVGEWTSPVGRTRTLPAAGSTPSRLSLAAVNCQWIDTGRYGAYRHLVDEDLDLVLHLGDYIYELPGALARPDRVPTTLADFRLRYASYRSDPDLQAAHRRFPFVCTWDDHEVANNYMGDTLPSRAPGEAVRDIKAAAYQAWWENLPVRLDAPRGSDLAIYRRVDVGDLARIYVLDERQDSALPPCRDVPGVAGDHGDCAERTEADRTRLGPAQEHWLADATASSRATWDVLANPVVLAGVDAGTGATPSFYLDTWDGYPHARERLVDALAGTDNPIVLTGDYHAGMVLDVQRHAFEQGSPVVATELMSPPISSPLFPDDVSARTPQLRQQINAHGYLTVAFEPDRATARFRVLDDVSSIDSPIRTAATWRVDAGEPRAVDLSAAG